MSANSSGSVERFMLGANESKDFEVFPPGGSIIALDVSNGIDQLVSGDMVGASATVLLQSGEATPALPATLTTALAGANNDLRFQAVTPGVGGNTVTIEYLDPLANDSPLSITVTLSAIQVSLATGPAGAITSTAAQVAALIAGTPAAAALVWSQNAAGNDGTGVVTALAATPLTGGAAAATTYTTKATLTVVPGGREAAAGVCGKYCRIRNTGNGLATVVAKPSHRLQPVTSL